MTFISYHRIFINKIPLGIFLILLLTGCEDKPIVTVYDQSILQTPIACMRLNVLPDDTAITKTMHSLYPFDKDCPLYLSITYKNNIVCNSTHNVQSKSINGFPTSYLNMEIRKGFSLQYSYYIDLTEDVNSEDLKKGFKRMSKDLNFVQRE